MIILNLLPPLDKKAISKHYLILLSKDITFSLLLLSSILGTIFLICYFILIKNFTEISQNALTITQGNESMAEEIRKTNLDLKKAAEIQERNVNWFSILVAISDLAPADDIQLTNLEINQGKNLITISGKSLTRDSFLNFKQNLENSKQFQNIKSPLSNLLLAKNLNFRLEMELKNH